jgi:hypothetical protein
MRQAGNLLMCAVLICAMWLSACGSKQQLRCNRNAQCSPFDQDCNLERVGCRSTDDGATEQWVEIGSWPTPAAIYLNERFIGYSPMRYPMRFTSQDSRISLVAVPLYAGQAQQEEMIAVPPLPKRISFFMNNPALDTGAGESATSARSDPGAGKQ